MEGERDLDVTGRVRTTQLSEGACVENDQCGSLRRCVRKHRSQNDAVVFALSIGRRNEDRFAVKFELVPCVAPTLRLACLKVVLLQLQQISKRGFGVYEMIAFYVQLVYTHGVGRFRGKRSSVHESIRTGVEFVVDAWQFHH